ncbi:unnamed protein product [Schistosoma rodhaini]|uniref:Uncharacterized protein n=1 Tax=Schistosoma rodhaini TaxID=6188 RepID=A0AA85F7K9_9TREM|nr:unnamed protein product [Schistosoma rodhaini]
MRVKFRTACRLEGELKKIHWMLSKLYERKVKSFFDFMMSVTWKYLPESDEELEIPIVPDLSSVEEQSVAFHCAVAPSVVINKIPAYSELSQDLPNHGTLPLLIGSISMCLLMAD